MPRSRSLNPSPKEIARADPANHCGARNVSGKNAGKPCTQLKGAGTDHPGYGNCLHHGGNTKAGVVSAMKEMGHDLVAQYKAEHMKFGGNRHDPSIATLTPEQALLEEVRRAAAMVRFLEERISNWTLGSGAVDATTLERWETIKQPGAGIKTLREGVRDFLSSLDPDSPDSPFHLPPLSIVHDKTGIVSFTDAKMWLDTYREERSHLVRTAKLCIDAGVAQRLVTIAEDQGRILASALRLVLEVLNLSAEQQALVPKVVPPILRAVATDSPLPSLPELLPTSAE